MSWIELSHSFYASSLSASFVRYCFKEWDEATWSSSRLPLINWIGSYYPIVINLILHPVGTVFMVVPVRIYVDEFWFPPSIFHPIFLSSFPCFGSIRSLVSKPSSEKGGGKPACDSWVGYPWLSSLWVPASFQAFIQSPSQRKETDRCTWL